MRHRGEEQHGFGTIEVLIAVALYGIALVSLMGLLITTTTAGSIGDSSSIAVNLARQRIETLAVMPVPSILTQNGVTTTTQVPPGQGRSYTLITAVDDQPTFVDITVTVQWSVGGAQAYSRRLMTRVAK